MPTKFKVIRLPEPSDLIIKQILTLLQNGEIKPGEQLPAEPVLQQAFQVSKQQLKVAFQRMETYGVVETKPQSGTYISNFPTEILIALIDNILNIRDMSNHEYLLEARTLIEEKAIELACDRMSKQDYEVLQSAHEKLIVCIREGKRGIAQDIYFHLELVRCCCNPILISSYSMMIKELVNFWETLDEEIAGNKKRLENTKKEHEAILQALKTRNAPAAKKAMQAHLKKVYESASNMKKKS